MVDDVMKLIFAILYVTQRWVLHDVIYSSVFHQAVATYKEKLN